MTRPIMSRLLRALFLTNDRNNQSRRRRHAIKPALENLEDRSTPSVVPHAIARPDWTDTDGNNPVRVHVLLNDSPSQATFGGKPVTLVPGSIAIVRGPAHGTLTVNRGKGTVTYKSDDPFTGNDSFLYTVKDSRGAISNIAAARVQVSRPTAADDWADTDATNPVTINVLDNDSDPDGNVYLQFPGSVSLRTGPAHGSVTLDQTTNSFTYQANGNFTGTDSFTYIVTNGSGAASAPGRRARPSEPADRRERPRQLRRHHAGRHRCLGKRLRSGREPAHRREQCNRHHAAEARHGHGRYQSRDYHVSGERGIHRYRYLQVRDHRRRRRGLGARNCHGCGHATFEGQRRRNRHRRHQSRGGRRAGQRHRRRRHDPRQRCGGRAAGARDRLSQPGKRPDHLHRERQLRRHRQLPLQRSRRRRNHQYGHDQRSS